MRLRRWTAGGPAAAAGWAVVVLALLFAISPAAGAPSVRTADCHAQGATPRRRQARHDNVLVDLGGVTCAFAKPWVAKLTHARPAKYDAEGKLTGGPRGWTCGSGRGYPALAFKGGCCKGPPECRSGSSTYFSWKPRYHDDNPARRVYTYDVSLVGSATVTYSESWGGGTVSSRWAMTVNALSSFRPLDTPAGSQRSTGRPAGSSSRSMARRLVTATATTDSSQASRSVFRPRERPIQGSRAGAGDIVGTVGIAHRREGVPGCSEGPIDVGGGPLDGQGLRTGLAGLCWELTPASGSFVFPNNHKRPRSWLPPWARS